MNENFKDKVKSPNFTLFFCINPILKHPCEIKYNEQYYETGFFDREKHTMSRLQSTKSMEFAMNTCRRLRHYK